MRDANGMKKRELYRRGEIMVSSHQPRQTKPRLGIPRNNITVLPQNIIGTVSSEGNYHF